ncbi:MAG: hypothetical protein R2725_15570 [Solirubrobacterales bacterium]
MLRRLILCGLLALGLVGVQAGMAEAATYEGKTAQKRSIRIAGNAKSIEVKRFKVELKCRNGTVLVDDESGFLRTPLRQGRFEDRQFGSTDTVWFRGRRKGKRISGKLRVTDKLGSGVRCNSGWVKFDARLRG